MSVELKSKAACFRPYMDLSSFTVTPLSYIGQRRKESHVDHLLKFAAGCRQCGINDSRSTEVISVVGEATLEKESESYLCPSRAFNLRNLPEFSLL